MGFPISGSFSESQIKKLNEISNDPINQTRKKSQQLDKDAFLKLMMTQLQNQNPLSPTDNAEYMNQMAQFSSVEQLTNIAASQDKTNELNALISKQLEDMVKVIEKQPGTSGSSDEVVKTQKSLLEQNSKILEELMKMNTMLSSYMGQNDSKKAVVDEDLFSILGM